MHSTYTPLAILCLGTSQSVAVGDKTAWASTGFSFQPQELSFVHGKQSTLPLSWKSCIGCRWESESIIKSCPWHRNAMKVRHRSTCRNSFRDIFLHDSFARRLNHVCGFQVLLKNTPKNSLVSELSLTLPPGSGMPYHKQSVLFLPCWSFQLYNSLWKFPSALM